MPNVLLADLAFGSSRQRELLAFRQAGFDVTANVHGIGDDSLAQLSGIGGATLVDFDSSSQDELVSYAGDASGFDIIKFRGSVPFTAYGFEELTSRHFRHRLRLIGRAATGTDNFDLVAAREFGVSVIHTPGANAVAVAEFTIGLMISGLRRLPQLFDSARARTWRDENVPLPSGTLQGATVGLIGLGDIGFRVAELARGFGAHVVVVSSDRFTPAMALDRGVSHCESLPDLLAQSDVISLHAPLTEATRHMLGPAEFARMRPSSILVNTSRGALIDETALNASLNSESQGPAVAMLDVLEKEGHQFQSVLLDNRACYVTPHVAGMTSRAMQDASDRVVKRLIQVFKEGASSGWENEPCLIPA